MVTDNTAARAVPPEYAELKRELAALQHRLDHHEARDEIRRIKARYMQWCDDRRGRQIAELFWDDGVWEGVGLDAGTVAGSEAIGEMFQKSLERLSFTVHYLTNESITIDGDKAIGRWKLLEPCTVRKTTGVWQGGRYVNDFERRDGEWRIAHLRLFLDFRTPYHQDWARDQMARLD